MPTIPLQDRLIVALDVPTVDEARDLVRRLGGAVSFYKIGLQLQYAGGIALAAELKRAGRENLSRFEAARHRPDRDRRRRQHRQARISIF